jgi:hypothetical protein
MVWKHGTLHVKYTTIQKKLKTFGAHLIRKKTFEKIKSTIHILFFECFKHIKELLKHNEFA